MSQEMCEFCGEEVAKHNVTELGMFLCKRHSGQYYEMGRLYKRTVFDPNEIVLKDKFAEVILYNAKHEEVARSKIDLEDVERVEQYKWGYTNGYCINNSNQVFLHNFILNRKPSEDDVVDHINRNRLDNRRSNLRVVDYRMNGFNKGMQSNNTSGYVGVSWDKGKGKWEASIKSNRKKIFLGYYDDIKDAAQAREKAELKYFGEIRDKRFDKNTIFKEK